MKLATVIRESGLDPILYPNASQISIDLRDENWDNIPEPVHYHEPLFANNPSTKKLFVEFLRRLEESLSDELGTLPSMDVRISEKSVFIRVSHPFFYISFFDRQPEC